MVNPQSDNEMQNTTFCEQNVRSIVIYGGTRNFENLTLNVSVITIKRNVMSYATQDIQVSETQNVKNIFLKLRLEPQQASDLCMVMIVSLLCHVIL
jgi:hypothetical protein